MKDLLKMFEDHMTAAAFAEEGDRKTCLEILHQRDRTRPRPRGEQRVEASRPRPELRAPSRDE
ncbi:MAG: hypothetical protein V1816_07860 [Pseudomonadota bacterium]